MNATAAASLAIPPARPRSVASMLSDTAWLSTLRAAFPTRDPVSAWPMLTGAGGSALTMLPSGPRSMSRGRQMPALKGRSP